MTGATVTGYRPGNIAGTDGFLMATDAVVVVNVHIDFGPAVFDTLKFKVIGIIILLMTGAAIFFSF